MSKIFEAIENARRGETVSDEPLSPPSVSLPVSRQPGRVDVDMEPEMISLYQTITAALPNINHRSVLFVGSRSNEGTSTVARELAKAASLRMEKNVLLIDLDRSRPEHHIYTKSVGKKAPMMPRRCRQNGRFSRNRLKPGRREQPLCDAPLSENYGYATNP